MCVGERSVGRGESSSVPIDHLFFVVVLQYNTSQQRTKSLL